MLARVGCPLVIPKQCDKYDYEGGGLPQVPDNLFLSQELELDFVKNWSF